MKKFVIINEHGTSFNSFYGIYDKQGVFSNKCYSTFSTRNEAEQRLRNIREQVNGNDDVDMIKYWNDKFDKCTIVEMS